jgi:hypothetical protein
VACGLVATLAAVVACDGDSHIYSARPFDSAHDCLAIGVAIDVISGGTSSFGCAPECLVYNAPDAAQAIYVSDQCGPYPQGASVTESQADVGDASDPCGPAIAAYLGDGGVCSDDGGDAGAD